MKVREFEEAILAKGLKPKEVRLEHNHVKWFICEGNKYYDIIVYDRNGKALVQPYYTWPDEVHNIRIETLDGGVTIDGEAVYRVDTLDLVFPDKSEHTYKIVKTKHRPVTQGLLRLCAGIPDEFYEEYKDKEEVRRVLNWIYDRAKKTTFLRRNKQEPLTSFYNISKTDDCIGIESNKGIAYMQFNIVEV